MAKNAIGEKTPCKGGIYRITLKTDGRTYVGQTRKPFRDRWRNHLYELNRGSHPNNYLQNAWIKYGKDLFEFAVLEPIQYVEDLNEAEARWMALYSATEQGFNLAGSGSIVKRSAAQIERDLLLRQSAQFREQARLKTISRRGFDYIAISPRGELFLDIVDLMAFSEEHSISKHPDFRDRHYCLTRAGWYIERVDREAPPKLYCFLKTKRKKRAVERIKHGHSSINQSRLASPSYISWVSAKSKCYREKDKDYCRYGAKGITVCDRWRNSFEAFLEDMGERPEGAVLRMLDRSQGYKPGNCVWAVNHKGEPVPYGIQPL